MGSRGGVEVVGGGKVRCGGGGWAVGVAGGGRWEVGGVTWGMVGGGR